MLKEVVNYQNLRTRFTENILIFVVSQRMLADTMIYSAEVLTEIMKKILIRNKNVQQVRVQEILHLMERVS